MSKTNHETMQPEAQAGEGLKLDVTVRPIAPMGNLLAFANVTIGDCFKIDGLSLRLHGFVVCLTHIGKSSFLLKCRLVTR